MAGMGLVSYVRLVGLVLVMLVSYVRLMGSVLPVLVCLMSGVLDVRSHLETLDLAQKSRRDLPVRG